jgi:hypothetical protein
VAKANREAERTCQQEARILSRSRHRDDKRVSSEKTRESELSPIDGFERLMVSAAKEEAERTSFHKDKNSPSFEKRHTAGCLALGVDHPLWRTIETEVPVICDRSATWAWF